jgi:hypothetical protein
MVGRVAAMREVHVNKPEGRNYNTAFGRWLKQFGFDDLDKGVRFRLFKMMDRLAAIEAWRATLTVTERLELNHPNTVIRRFTAATTTPKVGAQPKLSAYAKLQADHMAVIEECHRMKREIERGGGDLWTPEDRPKDIAHIIVCKLSKSKAENVAHEILKALKAGAP